MQITCRQIVAQRCLVVVASCSRDAQRFSRSSCGRRVSRPAGAPAGCRCIERFVGSLCSKLTVGTRCSELTCYEDGRFSYAAFTY